MRKGLLLFIVFAGFLMLNACSSGDKKGAMAISQKISAINDTVFHLGNTWSERVGQAVATKDFSTISVTRLRVLHFVDTALATVTAMKDVDGSEELRNTEIEFLNFEHQMFSNVAVMEKYNETTSDEEILKAFDDLKVVARHETNMLTAIQVLQQQYAVKNRLADTPNK